MRAIPRMPKRRAQRLRSEAFALMLEAQALGRWLDEECQYKRMVFLDKLLSRYPDSDGPPPYPDEPKPTFTIGNGDLLG